MNIIKRGLQSKDAVSAKKYYRKIAMNLHPDKNKHPMAKDAFQKL